MENQAFENLLKKANANELTAEDMNVVVRILARQRNADVTRLGKEIQINKRGLQDIEEEYPLLPPEADDLSNAVKRKGVQVLGGKKSNAYKNLNLRRMVYRDIYSEIKRQYGLVNPNGTQMGYKKLKRKYLSGAMDVVDGYVPPIALENDITAENELEDID